MHFTVLVRPTTSQVLRLCWKVNLFKNACTGKNVCGSAMHDILSVLNWYPCSPPPPLQVSLLCLWVEKCCTSVISLFHASLKTGVKMLYLKMYTQNESMLRCNLYAQSVFMQTPEFEIAPPSVLIWIVVLPPLPPLPAKRIIRLV